MCSQSSNSSQGNDSGSNHYRFVTPLLGSGTGSEVMTRIAAPMVGGIVSVTVLALIVIPAIYAAVKEFSIRRENRRATISRSAAAGAAGDDPR